MELPSKLRGLVTDRARTRDTASPRPTKTTMKGHKAAEKSPPPSTEKNLQDVVQRTLDASGGYSGVKFTWRVARAFVMLKIQPAETFSLSGIPFSAWPRTKIPTLGASPASCRVQEMYNVTLAGVGEKGEDIKLFVKVVPMEMWRLQWEAENQWNGEYATDGENFVMEAAALAFLHEYAPGVAPKLLGILEISQPPKGSTRRRKEGGSSAVTHIAVISEFYGEDLLDFLDRRDRLHKPLSEEEKRALQIGCILLLKRLHGLGLAHLDFTPENILLGPNGLRLCDFAKATPLWSSRLRHVTPLPNRSIGSRLPEAAQYPFESCEPTVGKGAYMPPECWRVYWRLESQKVLKPLEDLLPLRSPDERMAFYFTVHCADVYMLGVVLFWIWSEGGVWRCSDPRQDEKYYHLTKSGMNFDLFRECRNWPSHLKESLARGLQPEPWRRATIDELIASPWCQRFTTEVKGAKDLLKTYCSPEMLAVLSER